MPAISIPLCTTGEKLRLTEPVAGQRQEETGLLAGGGLLAGVGADVAGLLAALGAGAGVAGFGAGLEAAAVVVEVDFPVERVLEPGALPFRYSFCPGKIV